MSTARIDATIDFKKATQALVPLSFADMGPLIVFRDFAKKLAAAALQAPSASEWILYTLIHSLAGAQSRHFD